MIKRILAVSSAVAVTAGLAASPALADSTTKPVDITHIKNEAPIQPNAFNKAPECNPWSQYRTHITSVKRSFDAVGAVEMSNYTDNTVPLTQTTSVSQKLTLSVQGDIGGDFSGVAAKVQPGISYELGWGAGQTLGPYNVAAGQTARATYGFNKVEFSGTQQYCKLDGRWSNPWPFYASAPLSKAVHLETYANGSDPVNNY